MNSLILISPYKGSGFKPIVSGQSNCLPFVNYFLADAPSFVDQIESGQLTIIAQGGFMGTLKVY
ncbi:hypothetical protein [Microcoleus sp. bin38.metabat.b11b12b14.051]|uniref:hypothetical protein n=1 Tax=Microcoleus sp. bin38.metabat.b11b12b14.051 TaxID=2742709 RepID=UPI0025E69D7A|nr:hypothetical protein [Microcoleus sp. bin38.metabat.b11b12b14.051]